jgi:hypothetical protein
LTPPLHSSEDLRRQGLNPEFNPAGYFMRRRLNGARLTRDGSNGRSIASGTKLALLLSFGVSTLLGCSSGSPASSLSPPPPTASTASPHVDCQGTAAEMGQIDVCTTVTATMDGHSFFTATYMNQSGDSDVVVEPTYSLWSSNKAPIQTIPESLVSSESGLLALPNGGWVEDYGFVPAATATITVSLTASWKPRASAVARYQSLRFWPTCFDDKPFAGCEWINPNSYDIRVRSRILLMSDSTGQGGGNTQQVVDDGPTVLLKANSTTLVPVSDGQAAAVSAWLIKDAANGFRPDVEPTLDQSPSPSLESLPALSTPGG